MNTGCVHGISAECEREMILVPETYRRPFVHQYSISSSIYSSLNFKPIGKYGKIHKTVYMLISVDVKVSCLNCMIYHRIDNF